MGTYVEIDETAVRQILEALGVYTQPNMDKLLRKAAAAGANAYRAPLRAAAPVKGGGSSALRGSGGAGNIGTGKVGSDYGKPGDLRDSIKQRRVRSDSGGISAVVGPMGHKAFTRRWVTHGTKAHEITARQQAARAGISLARAAGNVRGGHRHTLALPGGFGTGLAFRASVRHPGGRPNNFIARVGAENRGRSHAAMVRAITRAAKNSTGSCWKAVVIASAMLSPSENGSSPSRAAASQNSTSS